MVWQSGDRLRKGEYVIEKVLGQGGFGITYKARHVALNEQVVIKTPHEYLQHRPEYDKYVKRFKREGQTLARFSQHAHPNIVRVRDLFREGKTHCLVMDFVPGENLSQLVKRKGRLPEAEAISCMRQIGDALEAIHQTGLVHRDAHPRNIIVREDGRAILIDFGIAKELVPTTMSSTGNQGNPLFAPYELLLNGSRGLARKPTVDVYCLAATIYYVVTGQPPTASSDRKLNNAILVPPKQIVSGISEQLNGAILQGMALEAKDRPQSMQQWLQLLEPPQTFIQLPPVNQNLRREIVRGGARNAGLTRSRFLKWAGFGGAGVIATILTSSLLSLLKKRSLEKELPIKPSKGSPISFGSGYAESPATPKTPEINPNDLPGLPDSATTFKFEVVTVNARGEEINRRPGEAQFFQEDLGNGISLEMVAIPGGNFWMGSPETEKERDSDEGPKHEVHIPPFLISKYEITQAQWTAVAALSVVERGIESDPSQFKGAKRPVEQVSWFDATEFCKRLSEKTGREYRLPSEAEWEYACRVGTTTTFHFGETITPEFVNYDGNNTYASGAKGQYRQQTTDVGSFLPNAFGLYDMHGNVWEWCADHWHENYQNAPSNGTIWLSSNKDSARVTRGGSWYSNPRGCRSASRNSKLPSDRNSDLGFRVVVAMART